LPVLPVPITSRSQTGSGITFPAQTAKRADFVQIVRAVDQMFTQEDSAKLWCLGVEGVTYTTGERIQVKFVDAYANVPVASTRL
jgi:putative aldouronate transport system substrate-binding protein